MVRRGAAALLVAVLVLATVARDGTNSGAVGSPPVSPVSAMSPESLCERLRSTVPGSWRVEPKERTRSLVPLSDSCWLIGIDRRGLKYRFSVSAEPQGAEAVQRYREEGYGYGYLSVVEGEVGPSSYIAPYPEEAYLVFTAGGHWIRISAVPGGREAIDGLRSMARAVAALPNGIPAKPPLIRRPECEPGTAAAEKLLDGPATVRRDELKPSGLVRCLWGTRARTVFAEAGRGPGSRVGKEFAQLLSDRPLNISPKVESVAIADEGFTQHEVIVFRFGRSLYVAVGAAPEYDVDPAKLRAFAHAMVPVYRPKRS